MWKKNTCLKKLMPWSIQGEIYLPNKIRTLFRCTFIAEILLWAILVSIVININVVIFQHKYRSICLYNQVGNVTAQYARFPNSQLKGFIFNFVQLSNGTILIFEKGEKSLTRWRTIGYFLTTLQDFFAAYQKVVSGHLRTLSSPGCNRSYKKL